MGSEVTHLCQQVQEITETTAEAGLWQYRDTNQGEDMQAIIKLFVTGIMLTLTAACGPGGGDVLATFDVDGKSENITRDEFYRHLGRRKKFALSSRGSQKNYLNNLIFQKLCVQEAKKMGLEKDPKFLEKFRDHVDKRLLISYLLTTKFGMPLKKFSVKGHRIRHLVVKVDKYKTISIPDPNRNKTIQRIMKNVKDPKKRAEQVKRARNATIRKREKRNAAELAAADKEAREKVEQARQELKAGKAFAEVAKKYGQDSTRTKGGDLGYLFAHQRRMDRDFMEAALKLKPGETSGIVKSAFGYHLIHCDEVVTMTESNVEKFFKDKNERKRKMSDIRHAAIWGFIDDIVKNDKNVVHNRDKLDAVDDGTVVFSVKSSDYSNTITMGEIRKEMRKLTPYSMRRYGIKREKGQALEPFSLEEKQAFFDFYITWSVLRYGAYKTGARDDPEFKKQLQQAKERILSRVYQEKMAEGIKVSDKDIQQEYKVNKKRYVKRERTTVGGKPKMVTTQLSLAQARDKIKSSLISRKKRSVVNSLRSKLMSKYKVQRFEDRFEIQKQKKRRPSRRRRPPRRPRSKVRRPAQKKNR